MISKLLLALALVILVAATAFSQTQEDNVDSSQFLGRVNGSVYTNNYFGFRVHLPEHWQPVDQDDLRKSEELASDLFKQLSEASKTVYVRPKFTTITLLYLKKKKLGEKDNSLFRISTTKQPNFRDLLIGGRNFATLEYEVRANPRVILYNRHFVTVIRGHSVGFTISFHTAEEGKYLEGLVKSIDFDAN